MNCETRMEKKNYKQKICKFSITNYQRFQINRINQLFQIYYYKAPQINMEIPISTIKFKYKLFTVNKNIKSIDLKSMYTNGI